MEVKTYYISYQKEIRYNSLNVWGIVQTDSYFEDLYYLSHFPRVRKYKNALGQTV